MAPDYFAGYWIKRIDAGTSGSEQDFVSDPIPPGLRIVATIVLNAHRVYTSAVRDGFGGEATALIYGWDIHTGGVTRPVSPPPYDWHAITVVDNCASVRAYLFVSGGEAEATVTLTGWKL